MTRRYEGSVICRIDASSFKGNPGEKTAAMRACFGSVLHPTTASPPLRPLHHPAKPLSQLYLPRIKISLATWTSQIQRNRVLKEAVEVEPGAPEEVPEGGSELGVNGFPPETKEDGLDSSPKVSSRKKKKRPEESESGYDRYKLRNGREVGSVTGTLIIGVLVAMLISMIPCDQKQWESF